MRNKFATTWGEPVGDKNIITNDSIENHLIVALIKCSGNKLTDFFCIHVQFELSKKARLMVFSYNDSSDEDWWSEWYQEEQLQFWIACVSRSRAVIVWHVPCHLKQSFWHSQDMRVSINWTQQPSRG